MQYEMRKRKRGHGSIDFYTPKSLFRAVILSSLFGPLGLFYLSPLGAIMMIFIGVAMTIALGLAGLWIVWFISVLASAIWVEYDTAWD